MPSTFAYLVLLSWPLVALALYLRTDKLLATFWTIVGGYLLLPQGVAIDLPYVPPLDKNTVPAVSALLIAKFVRGYYVPLLTSERFVKLVVVGFLVTPYFTLPGNGAPILRPDGGFVPAYGFYDAFTASINRYLMLLPLILAQALVKGKQDLGRILKMLVLAALAYSLLVLFELRMSPQLHRWVYGFNPHSFLQQMRFGGYRAQVFLGHGLVVSLFLAVTAVAAAAIWRSRSMSLPVPIQVITFWLVLVLVLSKSLGAIFIGLSAIALLLWSGARVMRVVTSLIAGALLFFPVLKWSGVAPGDVITEWLAPYFPERVASLLFRMRHEDALFLRALEKPIFGWGSWGRNRLSDSVTDGYWIIVLGGWGVVGYALTFILPWLAVRRLNLTSLSRNVTPSVVWYALGVSTALAVILVDLIPNASASPMFWFLVGSGLAMKPAIPSSN